MTRVLSVGVVIDEEPLQKLLVKVSNDLDPTNWAEGMVTLDRGASGVSYSGTLQVFLSLWWKNYLIVYNC